MTTEEKLIDNILILATIQSHIEKMNIQKYIEKTKNEK